MPAAPLHLSCRVALVIMFRNGPIRPWNCLWQPSVGPSVRGKRCAPLSEMRQLPFFRAGVMANDPLSTISGSEFKIPVLRCQPTVKDLHNFQTVFTNLDPAWRFLTAISSVAFHLNAHVPLTLTMLFPPNGQGPSWRPARESAIKLKKHRSPRIRPAPANVCRLHPCPN